MTRSPIMAVVMGIIPFVNLYLIYKWWEELKAFTKEDYNVIVRTICMCIPLVNLYFGWKLMVAAEEVGTKKGTTGYPLGVVGYLVICVLFFWVLGIPLLYLIYKTQELLNAAE